MSQGTDCSEEGLSQVQSACSGLLVPDRGRSSAHDRSTGGMAVRISFPRVNQLNSLLHAALGFASSQRPAHVADLPFLTLYPGPFAAMWQALQFCCFGAFHAALANGSPVQHMKKRFAFQIRSRYCHCKHFMCGLTGAYALSHDHPDDVFACCGICSYFPSSNNVRQHQLYLLIPSEENEIYPITTQTGLDPCTIFVLSILLIKVHRFYTHKRGVSYYRTEKKEGTPQWAKTAFGQRPVHASGGLPLDKHEKTQTSNDPTDSFLMICAKGKKKKEKKRTGHLIVKNTICALFVIQNDCIAVATGSGLILNPERSQTKGPLKEVVTLRISFFFFYRTHNQYEKITPYLEITLPGFHKYSW